MICEHCKQTFATLTRCYKGLVCSPCNALAEELTEHRHQVDRACQVVLALAAFNARAEVAGVLTDEFGELRYETEHLIKLRDEEHRLSTRFESLKNIDLNALKSDGTESEGVTT